VSFYFESSGDGGNRSRINFLTKIFLDPASRCSPFRYRSKLT